MDQPTQAPLPRPTDAEREFWRRAVEAERRRSRVGETARDADQDES